MNQNQLPKKQGCFSKLWKIYYSLFYFSQLPVKGSSERKEFEEADISNSELLVLAYSQFFWYFLVISFHIINLYLHISNGIQDKNSFQYVLIGFSSILAITFLFDYKERFLIHFEDEFKNECFARDVSSEKNLQTLIEYDRMGYYELIVDYYSTRYHMNFCIKPSDAIKNSIECDYVFLKEIVSFFKIIFSWIYCIFKKKINLGNGNESLYLCFSSWQLNEDLKIFFIYANPIIFIFFLPIFKLQFLIILSLLTITIYKKLIIDFEQRHHTLEISLLEIKQIEKKTQEKAKQEKFNQSNEFVNKLLKKIKNLKKLSRKNPSNDFQKKQNPNTQKENPIIFQNFQKPLQERPNQNQIPQKDLNYFQNPMITKVMNAVISKTGKKNE